MNKVKFFDFEKKPRKPFALLRPIIRVVVFPVTAKRKMKLIKTNMDKIEGPSLILANHGSFLDFFLMFRAIYPMLPNYPVAIDGFRDFTEVIMRLAGAIGKRKFNHDIAPYKNMEYCAKELKNSIVLYPEARYSFDGSTSFLPSSLPHFVKKLGLPLVIMKLRGNYIAKPQWNKKSKYAPAEVELRGLLTSKELEDISVEELDKLIRENFAYDDFAYQKERGIEITYEKRAEGLNKILYQCSSCGKEFEMYSEGTQLYCASCGKRWEMTALGELSALDGKDTFTHIPDWYKWERENVRKEIEDGTYFFEDEVDVQTLPNAKRFYKHGRGKLRQTRDGMWVECTVYGEQKNLRFSKYAIDSTHVEFEYRDMGDAIDVSDLYDSYWLHPVNSRDVCTKIALAVEEAYLYAERQKKERKESKKQSDI